MGRNSGSTTDNLRVMRDMVTVNSMSSNLDQLDPLNDSDADENDDMTITIDESDILATLDTLNHEKTETRIVYGDDDGYNIQSPEVNEEELVQIDATPEIDNNDEYLTIENTE